MPVLRCGATLSPRNPHEVSAVAAVAATARANGVEATLRDDGALELPGEG